MLSVILTKILPVPLLFLPAPSHQPTRHVRKEKTRFATNDRSMSMSLKLSVSATIISRQQVGKLVNAQTEALWL